MDKKYGKLIKNVDYSIIRDTKNYYRLVGDAIEKAESYVCIVGWHFSLSAEYKDGEKFLDLFERKFQENKDFRVYILIWSGARVAVRLREWWKRRRLDHRERIFLRFATDFPFGGSHHAKFIMIDNRLVFTGGMDIVNGREDEESHCGYNNFHDFSWVFRGESMIKYAQDYLKLRWKKYLSIEDEIFDKVDTKVDELLNVDFNNGNFLVSKNLFKHEHYEYCNELELWTNEMIRNAEKRIFIENQYFSSNSINREMIALPEDVKIEVVLPVSSENNLAKCTIDYLSYLEIKHFYDFSGRKEDVFYNLYNKNDEPVYIHAKVMLVDDKYLKIGSGNLASRSFGLDSEMDFTLIGDSLESKKIINQFYQDEKQHLNSSTTKLKKVSNERRWLYFIPKFICDLFDKRMKFF